MSNKITVLGSGTCLSSFYKPFDFRYSSGHLIQFKNKNILLDCSEGIRQRLNSIKFDFYNLDAIFISHFHPDHFTLAPLIQSIGIRSIYEKKTKKLPIFGPPTIEKIFLSEWDLKHGKNHFTNTWCRLKYMTQFVFQQYKGRLPIELYPIKVTPFKVIHGNMDAYALRFQLDNKVITYSGDSGFCDSLIEAARGCDYFLCESSFSSTLKNPDLNEHLTPFHAGQIAKEANAKNLILVHYSGADSKNQMLKSIKQSGFTGSTTIARDFQAFPL